MLHRKHWLLAAMQTIPVTMLQAKDVDPPLPPPHAHATVLMDDPSSFEHGSPFEHVLVDDMQNNPVVPVHGKSPHKHGPVLEVVPPV